MNESWLYGSSSKDITAANEWLSKWKLYTEKKKSAWADWAREKEFLEIDISRLIENYYEDFLHKANGACDIVIQLIKQTKCQDQIETHLINKEQMLVDSMLRDIEDNAWSVLKQSRSDEKGVEAQRVQRLAVGEYQRTVGSILLSTSLRREDPIQIILFVGNDTVAETSHCRKGESWIAEERNGKSRKTAAHPTA